jgi:NAD(P)H-dependent flavin oxidoreductase YrpB (nitropropane dioxygenase family)
MSSVLKNATSSSSSSAGCAIKSAENVSVSMIRLPTLAMPYSFCGASAHGNQTGFRGYRFAIEKGKLDRGHLPVGQATEGIHDAREMAELMERMVAEARTAHSRLSVIMNNR